MSNRILFLFLILSLLACGDDIGSNSHKGLPKDTTTTDSATPGEDTSMPRTGLHRVRASAPLLTTLQEIDATLKNILPPGYRRVPLMEIDDEGTPGANVVTLEGNRPSNVCGVGTEFSGLEARIADCALKNGESAVWNAYLSGKSGEADWQLVALNSLGKEIWLDSQTGLVWSDVQASTNWCKASGNQESPSPGVIVDCATLSESQSVCQGNSIEELGEDFIWRLPTRNDYLQADLDGIRFVLRTGSAIGSWTATMVSGVEGRTHAWVYHFQQGTLSAGELTSERQIRCIGVASR